VAQLPSLIVEDSEVSAFLIPKSEPNFVTLKRVSAPCMTVQPGSFSNQSLKGTIVVITQADPGYDWLFGHDIGGLVTMYGGANSHMSIRSAELGLPAAIGVGETLYSQCAEAQTLLLDCEARRIEVLSWR
jgi:phosphoenolpyruvate-protein kinase (PTS system EI component)